VDKLMLVAICYALCLVPVAVTGKIHPAPLKPASLEPTFFIQRVPQSLTTTLVAGLVIGSFYGLAPLYASAQGLPTERIGLFMACCIFAGLIAQWPIGWLSDRHDRSGLIRTIAIALTIAALPLAVLPHVPPVVLLPLGLIVSLLQFVLYPLAVALSNDHIEGEHRVSLSAMLLVTFGLGACIGPLAVGALMNLIGPNMLYAFVVLCGGVLIWRIRPDAVTGKHLVDEAPLNHVPMPEGSTSSPLAAALDPRVDSQVVQEQMHSEPPAETVVAAEEAPAEVAKAPAEASSKAGGP
ncbi:MFS transporter, partial [Pseudomonas oryzihabitans]